MRKRILILITVILAGSTAFFVLLWGINRMAGTRTEPLPYNTVQTETETVPPSIPLPLPPESSEADMQSATEAETETEAETIKTIYQPGFYTTELTEEIKARIYGLSYKEDCTVPYEELRYLSVLYTDFDGNTQTGELICNRSIAQDLVEIFYQLHQEKYPIGQIRLIDEFDADDDLSCMENNTSSFNYRVVEGSTKLSKHALGLAVDINPVYNPYVTYPDGTVRITPPGSEAYADRSADFPYKIDENDLCYRLFTEHGFTWGGHWKSLKDYQHFQKSAE